MNCPIATSSRGQLLEAKNKLPTSIVNDAKPWPRPARAGLKIWILLTFFPFCFRWSFCFIARLDAFLFRFSSSARNKQGILTKTSADSCQVESWTQQLSRADLCELVQLLSVRHPVIAEEICDFTMLVCPYFYQGPFFGCAHWYSVVFFS